MHVLLEQRIFGVDDLEHWSASLQGSACHAWLVPEDVLPTWSRARTFHYDDGRVLIVDHPIPGVDLLTLLSAFEHARVGAVDRHGGYFMLGAPLPLLTATSLVLEVARTLPEHPQRNVSISPLGVLVGRDGLVSVASPELMDLAKTMFTSWVGNPIQRLKLGLRYASREAAQGRDLTPASDAFSLAVMLYELATGQHPFIDPGATDFAFLEAVGNAAVAPPSRHVPSLPASVDALLLRGLGLVESRRFADTTAFARALMAAVALPFSPAQEVRAFAQQMWPHVPAALQRWRSPFCLDPDHAPKPRPRPSLR